MQVQGARCPAVYYEGRDSEPTLPPKAALAFQQAPGSLPCIHFPPLVYGEEEIFFFKKNLRDRQIKRSQWQLHSPNAGDDLGWSSLKPGPGNSGGPGLPPVWAYQGPNHWTLPPPWHQLEAGISGYSTMFCRCLNCRANHLLGERCFKM